MRYPPGLHIAGSDQQPFVAINAELNRKARLAQLYSPAELWERQQKSLAELKKLRPDAERRSKQK